eukprot:CAMPEP_0113869052 /NCGR_PEP_ID=MMETSP0780_2-20120614/1327_1 /TAXON_ID=652834 /ORGANISM="Palpitomonas bilix" /LENGTH=558 /DNA_ID=CAMNT_0000854197 /DNA_START=50 /DNA_END=1726 /DNA_ORIENTATION=+ /assembly_acc=CAM_ASM_000599
MDESIDSYFDVVVCGTGPAESILAGALARAGKKVLHVDKHELYGTPFTTVDVHGMCALVDSNGGGRGGMENGINECSLPSTIRRGRWTIHAEDRLGAQRRYNLDRMIPFSYCDGGLVNTLLKGGVGNYLEFQLISSLHLYSGDAFETVPSSKSDVFQTKTISMLEKRKLMKFMHACMGDEGSDEVGAEGGFVPQKNIEKVSTEEEQRYSDQPFLSFLSFFKLTEKLQRIVMFAICFATSEAEASQMKTKEGLRRLRRYFASMGKYGNSSFLWPLYGAGEVAQAFCRLCAVFGGTYVLRRSIKEVVMEEDDGKKRVKSIIDSNGQSIEVKAVVAGPEYLSPPVQEKGALLRWTGILDSPVVNTDGHTVALIFPPGSTGDGRGKGQTIRGLQMDKASVAAVEGTYVLHLEAYADHFGEANSVDEYFQPVISRLLRVGDSEEKEGKPSVLASFSFCQPVYDTQPVQVERGLFFLHSFGADLTFEPYLASAEEVFHSICGGEVEFLEKVLSPEEQAEQAELEAQIEAEERAKAAKIQTEEAIAVAGAVVEDVLDVVAARNGD